MENAMEDVAEEMQFDEAMFQFVAIEQEDEDEDEMEMESSWGGSKPGKSPNKPRDFQGAYEKVVRDYFNG